MIFNFPVRFFKTVELYDLDCVLRLSYCKCPIGRSRPLTPWGKTTLGKKTRRPKLYSNIYIIRSRNAA